MCGGEYEPSVQHSSERMNTMTLTPNTTTAPYRRKQYIINKSFQYRVVWRLVILMVSSMLLSQLLIIGYMKVREWLRPSSQSLLYFANQTTETLTFTRIAEVLWLPMVLTCLIGGLIVLFIGILISHREAGPLFNLKRVMKQVEEGNWNVTFRIRSKDEFHDVAESFNQMLVALKNRFESLDKLISALPVQERVKFDKILKPQKNDDQK
jgi:methyl-accepting chemotaxis protein